MFLLIDVLKRLIAATRVVSRMQVWTAVKFIGEHRDALWIRQQVRQAVRQRLPAYWLISLIASVNLAGMGGCENNFRNVQW